MESKDTYKLEAIKSIEKLADFDNEYVYDLEIENDHNFFANDILVHNSIYYEFGRITRQLGIPKEKEAEFTVKLWELGAGPFMDQKYKEYAKAYNCDENMQLLELEKVSRTGILFAKKHYALEASWIEPGIFLNELEDVIYKGLECIQGSTPKFAKECQTDFIKYVLKHFNHSDIKPTYSELVSKLKDYKAKFKLQQPEDICKGLSVGNYEKFILQDKTKIDVTLHCPIHVKASAIANFILQKHPKYKVKYNIIKSGDKVQFYYTTSPVYEVFAFLPNKYPLEYALPIDYDKMFETLILTPCNRVLEVLGYKPINSTLCYTAALW